MALTHKQRRVAKHIYDVGRRRGESRKEILAAIETALTEANLGNPSYGDRDSVGWRQERSHYGSRGKRMNVRGAANRFYDETSKANPRRYRTAGQLAQAVQRSAFPERYDQREGEAKRILRWLRKTYGKGGGGGGGMRYGTKTSVTRIPGVDNSELRQQLKAQYLANRHDPSALLNLAGGLSEAQDVPGQTIRRTRLTSERTGGGRRDARGRRTTTDIERIAAKARSMGLRVSGNQGVTGRPETSGHTAGSLHYQRSKNRRLRKKGWQGALDISGDPRKVAQLADYLSRRYGRDMEELIYRGPGSTDRMNIKRGKRVGKRFYTGHEGHLHAGDLD